MVGDFCAEPRLATPCTTAGVALADLPAIVVVIVSHNHDGHLDTNRVLALDQHAQSATLFIAGNDRGTGATARFDALKPPLDRIHRQLKQEFDPAGIFNPHRLSAHW